MQITGRTTFSSTGSQFSVPLANFDIFVMLIGSSKCDFIVKNSQNNVNGAYFFHSDLMNEFFGWFYIIYWNKLFLFPSKNKFEFISKISIWVLKRTALVSWILFFILKIHQRSFCTGIRYAIDLYLMSITDVCYSVVDRNLTIFLL